MPRNVSNAVLIFPSFQKTFHMERVVDASFEYNLWYWTEHLCNLREIGESFNFDRLNGTERFPKAAELWGRPAKLFRRSSAGKKSYFSERGTNVDVPSIQDIKNSMTLHYFIYLLRLFKHWIANLEIEFSLHWILQNSREKLNHPIFVA